MHCQLAVLKSWLERSRGEASRGWHRIYDIPMHHPAIKHVTSETRVGTRTILISWDHLPIQQSVPSVDGHFRKSY